MLFHNLPYSKIPYESIITNVEFGIQQFKKEFNNDKTKNIIRNEICNILKNFKINTDFVNCKNYKEKLIRKYFYETMSFLKENDNLMVSYADKGNITVVIDKNVYLDKINDLLNDKNTYEIVNKDLTESIQRKNNELISNWEGEKEIF